MTPATRTRSQIGKASRAKGARFERLITNAIRPWFPEVRRSRDNGSTTTTDTGDLTDTGPGLWWSLKDDKSGDSSAPGVIAAWMGEARDKASPGRIPLLVQKRHAIADPLMSWAWLWLCDVVELADGTASSSLCEPVRMELHVALDLLTSAGYTRAAS